MSARVHPEDGPAQWTVEAIWAEFSAPLLRFIRRRVGDQATAEDLLQDVFVAIQARREDLRDQERVAAWVYRIARNRVVDHYRAQRQLAPLSPQLAAEPAEAPDAAAALAPCLGAMVRDLPPDYRSAIELTAYAGVSQQALSQRLGMSFSGTKARVQRARQRLKARLLACCELFFDPAGRLMDYRPRPDSCAGGSCARCGSEPCGGCADDRSAE
jgi:RNA polymerase sigma-70 factor (ECF subfamily)